MSAPAQNRAGGGGPDRSRAALSRPPEQIKPPTTAIGIPEGRGRSNAPPAPQPALAALPRAARRVVRAGPFGATPARPRSAPTAKDGGAPVVQHRDAAATTHLHLEERPRPCEQRRPSPNGPPRRVVGPST